MKFHKTGIKCLHFKADFKIQLGSEQYKILLLFKIVQKFLCRLSQRKLLIISNYKRTLRHLFFHIQLEDIILVLGKTIIRNECNSKPDSCKIDQEIITCKLNFGNQVKLMLLEQAMKELVRCTVLIQHQDRIVEQIGKCQFLLL